MIVLERMNDKRLTFSQHILVVNTRSTLRQHQDIAFMITEAMSISETRNDKKTDMENDLLDSKR